MTCPRRRSKTGQRGLPGLFCALLAACTPSAGSPGPGPGPGPTPAPECDAACREQAKPDGCVSTQRYFEERAWPTVVSRCAACHVAGGAAAGSRMVLKSPSLPDAAAKSAEAFAQVAVLDLDGRPLPEQKATFSVAHGGGRVVEPGTEAHAVLVEAIERARTPVTCPDDEPDPPADAWEGIVLLDPAGTLRKATLHLAGRLPTEAEHAAVAAEGLDALDAIVAAQAREPAFHQRVRELFNDVFLTDAFDAENGDAALVSNDQVDVRTFPEARRFQSAALYSGCTPGTAGCLRPSTPELVHTSNALAREPVEFAVHALKEDLPLTTLVTAKYRLVNAWSARLFGLGFDGKEPGAFDPGAYDPLDFRPARLPGINESLPGAAEPYAEYAGVLTTPAWRLRYPDTCSNHNRKIARFTLKVFLDFDIMKNAARLDLSGVDLSMHPSRTNAQCTGCHTTIDPVAGAYQNWTKCHSAPARYYPPGERLNCGRGGWFGDEQMFPPGVAAGEANALPPEVWSHGLEKLGEHLAAQPDFARAMVRHVFAGLTGAPPLEAPQDPSAPGFAEADAAYEAQQAELAAVLEAFRAGGLRLPPLVVSVVKSRSYRAVDADRADRAELASLGPAAWVPPEVMHRRLESLLGAGWELAFQDARGGAQNDPSRGYGMLTRRDRARLFYGGIDSRAVTTRQRLPSGLASATADRMALELSCLHVARDFARPTASRRLFPGVDPALAPPADAASLGAAPFLAALSRLHEAFWGTAAAPDDPELLETYRLLVDAHAASVAAGGTLPKLCAGNFDPRTGVPDGTPAPSGPAVHGVRAWQAVLVHLLTDPRFLFE